MRFIITILAATVSMSAFAQAPQAGKTEMSEQCRAASSVYRRAKFRNELDLFSVAILNESYRGARYNSGYVARINEIERRVNGNMLIINKLGPLYEACKLKYSQNR